MASLGAAIAVGLDENAGPTHVSPQKQNMSLFGGGGQ